MNKPLIGITITEKKVSLNFIGRQPLAFVNSQLIKLVEDMGGIPVMLPTLTDQESTEAVLSNLDGIFFTGGEDIHPKSYNEDLLIKYSDDCCGMGVPFSRPTIMEPNPRRDAFEISLYRYAKELGLPMLAVCRGMQIVNIAEGGTLYQEIPETEIKHDLGENSFIHYHEIRIEPESRSASLIGKEEYIMSSIHHQAVKELGNDLMVAAKSSDGVIEIIEGKGDAFLVGIQGHPEQTMQNFPLVNNIFKAFIEEASLKKNTMISIKSIEVEDVRQLS